MKDKTKLLIIGAGGHGQSVAEAAELNGQFEVVGFVDDDLEMGTLVLRYPVLGTAADLTVYATICDQVVVAIGNNVLRSSLVDRSLQSGLSLATVVHAQAIVSPSAHLGAGSVVMAGAVIGTEARLGCGVIVNCGAVVDHHSYVHDFGHLGVNACMAGGSILGPLALMQAGAAIGYGVQLTYGAVLKPGEAL